MERKIYPENFENYLKKQADEFKMVPSKKVWRGIYNNIRPGARWPSITMSMVFIFALVIVGHLNSNKNYYKYKNGLPELSSLALKNKIGENKNPLATVHEPRIKNNFFNDDIATPEEPVATNTDLNGNTDQNNNSTTVSTNHIQQQNDRQDPPGIKNEVQTEINKAPVTTENLQDHTGKIVTDDNTQPASIIETNNTIIKNQPALISDQRTEADKIQETDENLNLPEKQAVSLLKHRKNGAQLLYYLTPSVSYRVVAGNDWTVDHHPMIGLEGGTSLGYKLSKHFIFTTGIQVNYSGYNIRSVNTHPVLSTITLNNGEQTYSVTGVSQYTNQTSNNDVKLKNYSLQASIPIGLQYTFADNGDIKFSAAASLQPFFLITNREYLLTTNGRNYITDPDLVRKWNMSSTFGTYISLRSNSLNWQIGPQVRYQLLSSFSKDYPFKEHLIDYGIRVGISRIFK